MNFKELGVRVVFVSNVSTQNLPCVRQTVNGQGEMDEMGRAADYE